MVKLAQTPPNTYLQGVRLELLKLTDLKKYKKIWLKNKIGVIFPLRPGHFNIMFLKCLEGEFCTPYSAVYKILKG